MKSKKLRNCLCIGFDFQSSQSVGYRYSNLTLVFNLFYNFQISTMPKHNNNKQVSTNARVPINISWPRNEDEIFL